MAGGVWTSHHEGKTMRMLKIKLPDRLTLISIVIVFAMSVYGIIRDCAQDTKIDELTFWNTAIRYRPLLKVLNPARVDSFEIFGSKKFAIKDLLPSKDTIRRVFDLPTRLKLHLTVRVTNQSRVLAKVYATAWADTTTMIDRIRQRILAADTSWFGYASDSANFHFVELFPGDTVDFKETREINFIRDDRFTIHFYVLYANELKFLYDSYSWTTFTTKPIVSKPEFRIFEGKLQFRLIPDDPTFKDFLKVADSQISSNTYTEQQSKLLNQLMEKMATY